MPKYTFFRDIPQLTECGQYETDVLPTRLFPLLDEYRLNYKADLDPDFQRPHVWTEAQQIAYIEFFLRGGKNARVLYFNAPWWERRSKSTYNDFVLVDGKQRIEAWRRFLQDEITAFDSKFSEFEDQMRLGGNTLRVNINTLQTRSQVLQWFLEMNSGGTPHTDDELSRVRVLLHKEKLAEVRKRKGAKV